MDPSIRYPPYTKSKVSSMLFLQRTSVNFKKIGFYILLVIIPILIYKYIKLLPRNNSKSLSPYPLLGVVGTGDPNGCLFFSLSLQRL